MQVKWANVTWLKFQWFIMRVSGVGGAGFLFLGTDVLWKHFINCLKGKWKQKVTLPEQHKYVFTDSRITRLHLFLLFTNKDLLHPSKKLENCFVSVTLNYANQTFRLLSLALPTTNWKRACRSANKLCYLQPWNCDLCDLFTKLSS